MGILRFDVPETDALPRLVSLVRPKRSGVYVVQAGPGGPVKVGWSSDLDKRLSAMQADNAEPLRVVRLEPGATWDRLGFRERFAGYRIRGDWYRAEILGATT